MSGPQCCSNPPTLDPSCGSGHVETVGGLSSYVIGSPQSNRAVVFVSGVFGYQNPKLRKVADKVASAGFYVVVPDFFYGDPYVAENEERPIQNKERPLHVWLKDHGVDKGFEDAKPVIEEIKSKGISNVGAAGFCWGAKVVIELASVEFIRAAVILHPAFVTADDFKGVKVPISILSSEIDEMTPPELLRSVRIDKPEIDLHVKIFPKVSHGWTVRYHDNDEAEVKSAEEAHENMLEWFVKYVK